MPGTRAPVVDRFWRNVIKGDNCWTWRNARGDYGKFRIGTKPPRSMRAHRFSWELHYGSIPIGLFVLHSCDNPPCVNPAHLRLGTRLDNMRDMRSRGRSTLGRTSPVEISKLRGARKLTDVQITEARGRSALGESSRSIAIGFGVSHTTVSRLVSGDRWKNYP